MKKKTLLIKAVGSLALASLLGSCGGGHTHTYIAHNEVPSNCAEKGTDFYYSCSDCSMLFDAEKKQIDTPPELELDPHNHKGTKTLRATADVVDYKIGDKVDLDKTLLKWACEYCDGVALNASERNNVTVTYPTEGADCFTVADSKLPSVTVTLNYNAYSTEITARVGKKDNAIVGLTNLEGHCGYEITALDQMVMDGKIVSTSGEPVQLLFSDTIDGTYTKRSEMSDDTVFNVRDGEESSVYYIKAETAPTEEYAKAVAGPVSLTITHNELKWDTSRSDYDFVGCMCKPDEVKKFNKVAANEARFLLSEESVTLDLTGSSFGVAPYTDAVIEGISTIAPDGTTIDLGKSLTISTEAFRTHEIYGRTEVFVTVSHGKIGEDIIEGTHIIEVPVLAVTKFISNPDEWDSIIPKEKGQVMNGYFMLTNDITIPSSKALGWVSGWAEIVFSATIDGDGHTLTTNGGAYGNFYYLEKATLKNMTIKNEMWDRTALNVALITQKAKQSTFENLTFKVMACNPATKETPFEPVTNCGYLFNNGGAQENSFIGCDFDFDGYVVPSLLCHSTNSTETNTFEDCILTCIDVNEIYFTNKGVAVTEPEGLTINRVAYEKVDMESVEFNAETGEAASIVLPEKYAGASVTSIDMKFNGEDINLGSSLSEVRIPEEIRSNPMYHGTTTITLTVTGYSGASKLFVPITIVTKEIKTTADLQALRGVNLGKKVYGYYVLNSDFTVDNNAIGHATSADSGTGNGFYGTFDGKGHTVTINTSSFVKGIFGTTCNGAIIKNVVFSDPWFSGGYGNTIVAHTMYGTTISDVTYKVTAGGGSTATSGEGLLCSAGQYYCTYKNVRVESSVKLGTLIAKDGNGDRDLSTFTNCSVKAPTLLGIVGSNLAVEGWTIE